MEKAHEHHQDAMDFALNKYVLCREKVSLISLNNPTATVLPLPLKTWLRGKKGTVLWEIWCLASLKLMETPPKMKWALEYPNSHSHGPSHPQTQKGEGTWLRSHSHRSQEKRWNLNPGLWLFLYFPSHKPAKAIFESLQWLSDHLQYPMRDPIWSKAPQTQWTWTRLPSWTSVALQVSTSSQKGPSLQAWARPSGHPMAQRTIGSLENKAHLGQLLGVGQIVHSDGQEHIQQCV